MKEYGKGLKIAVGQCRVVKNFKQCIGTCSFMIGKDKRSLDIAFAYIKISGIREMLLK